MSIDPNNARTPPRTTPPTKRPPTDKCPTCLLSLARHTRAERLECEAWQQVEAWRLTKDTDTDD